MSWLKYIVPLFGQVEIKCGYCGGRGRNSRGDYCWACHGTGERVVPRNEAP